MKGKPSRISLTAIDTAEIDPADPAGSWRRNCLTPRVPAPDVELELSSGCDGELVPVKLAVGLGGGCVSYRALRPTKGAWTPDAPRLVRRGIPAGPDAEELELEADLSMALDRDARGPSPGARRSGRIQRRAASEAYIARLPTLLAAWLELEALSAAEPPQGTALQRALDGPLGPPIPRSRRGRVREIDPGEVERLREEEDLSHWKVAGRLKMDPGSPATATYRARKRRQQIVGQLDQARAQGHTAVGGPATEVPPAAEEAQ